MQKIYDFINNEVTNGNTVLAYDRSKVKPHVYHIKDMWRVRLIGGVVYVDGVCIKKWTIARKP